MTHKLEIIDGTFGVWNDLSKNLCLWLFEVFHKSVDTAFTKKQNSFLLFKSSMEDILNSSFGFDIFSGFWFRLKNLVKEETPKLNIFNLQIGNKVEGAINLNVNGEKPNEDDMLTQSEEFVLRMMEESTRNHMKSDKKQEDFVLLLFRLLAVRYRIEFPLKIDTKHVIRKDIHVLLNSKICSAAFKYMTYNSPMRKEKKRSVSRDKSKKPRSLSKAKRN